MKRLHFIAFFALLLPFTAQAEFSYSWFEVGYIAHTEGDNAAGSEDGDGLDIRLNFLAGDTFYFTGHVSEIEFDDESELDRFGLGIGIHNDPAASVGLFATLTYEDLESGLVEEKGYGVSAGARYQLKEDIEINGGLKYASYDELESRFLNIGGVWAFHQSYALVGEYTSGEFESELTGDKPGLDELRVALRVQF
jgi:hypothetical protein